MSGSSSSSSGSRSSDWNDNCVTVNFTTQLTSPKPDVVDELSVDDVLDVVLTNLGTANVVGALFNGQLAGGIASSSLPKLRECLNEGYNYIATVTAIDDGMVSVKVTIAPKP